MMIVGQLVGAVVATAQELEMLGRDAQLAQTSISVSNHSELITLVADNILQLLHSDHLIKVRWLHITACSSPSFFLFFYFLSHCILSFCCLMANKDFIIYIHMYIYIYIYIYLALAICRRGTDFGRLSFLCVALFVTLLPELRLVVGCVASTVGWTAVLTGQLSVSCAVRSTYSWRVTTSWVNCPL